MHFCQLISHKILLGLFLGGFIGKNQSLGRERMKLAAETEKLRK